SFSGVTHKYLDNQPTPFPINVTVTDKDSATSTPAATTTATIYNAAPVLSLAPAVGNEGMATTFSLGSFTDPGADSPWAVDVDWGDPRSATHTTYNVTTTDADGITHQLGSPSHNYADNGTYTVMVKVTDKDNASDTKTFEVVVANGAPTVLITGAGDPSAFHF